MRGGINGARLRFEPQLNWKVNNPQELSKTIAVLEDVRIKFNKTLKGGKQVSFADIVVLAGGIAIEKAAKDAGIIVKVPFAIGRVDATIEQTDIKSFALLEPKYDGFRNYHEKNSDTSPIDGLIEKAYMLNLTIPQMTVLIGGLRVINANFDGSLDGVLTKTPGKLNNDFFINLLDNSTKWVKLSENGLYKGVDIATNEQKWTATPVDLVFGSSSELRAVAEVYASQDGKQKFVDDFVKAWVKVMNNDRF
jgi:catalase-peroxidase